MEILKFSEPPKRSSSKNARKKGGVMPLLSVVAAVAIVGGMSSTLAGTITLNGGTGVEFGQGIVTAAACDTSIKLTPTSSYESDTAKAPTNFVVSSLKVENVGLASGGSEGPGCKGKTLTIRAYTETGTVALFAYPSGSSNTIKFTLPATDTMTVGTNITKDEGTSSLLGIANEGLVGYNAGDPVVPVNSSATGAYFTLSGLSISSTAVRFTVESSGP